jgi:hypothetical protein
MILFAWVLAVLLLVIASIALVRIQRAETLWSRILIGVTAMVPVFRVSSFCWDCSRSGCSW